MDDRNKQSIGYRWAIITFLLVSVPFLFFASVSYKDLKESHKEEFQSLNREVIETFSSELIHYLSMLDGIKALFAASTNVEPDEWDAYLNSINEYDKFSAAKSIAFLPKVKSGELDRFLEIARKTVSPNYQITPPGKREVYFPVYYLTVFNSTDQSYGNDHYSIPEMRKAIDESINERKARVTGKINFTLPNSTNIFTKVIIYLPIYKKSPTNNEEDLMGMVACSMVPEYFFSPLLKNTRAEYFTLEIYEGNTANPQNLLLSTKSISSSSISHNPEYEGEYKKKFAGRDFTLKFYSTPEFEAKIDNLLPLIIGVAGVIIGVLSGGIVGFQIRSRKKAQELIEKIKKSGEELRRANKQLEDEIKEKTELLKEVEFEKHLFDELLENIPDAVYFKDKDSRFLRCSKYALYRIGLPLEEVIGKTDFDLFADEHAQEAF
ncbi:MAG TPA: CHASE domain-containing protein, partial [Verrucomicrobiota bacterium]|nr:CHASE domain-containing protein [Verrucomicrobiota bacterium]